MNNQLRAYLPVVLAAGILLAAVHRWFDTQLSEHGADAKPE